MKLGQLADEAEQNGEHCRAADNPHTVNFGDGHNADVLTVSGVRRCAEETGQNVGAAVRKQRAGQPRVFNQVAFDNVAGYNQMADVFI